MASIQVPPASISPSPPFTWRSQLQWHGHPNEELHMDRNGSLLTAATWVNVEADPPGPVKPSDETAAPGNSFTTTLWET